MTLRTLRLSLVGFLIAVGACTREAGRHDAFDLAARAIESKEKVGDVDAAAREWAELARTAPTTETRARAELGRARCEAALADRAHGRRLLESLPEQVEGHSLATLDAIGAQQAARFIGGPFEQEFRELQGRVRDLCRARALELRAKQFTAARAILERGDFCAALDALQQIERTRETDDREDVVKLLEETNAAADRAADALLAEAAAIATNDPAAALQKLDEAMPRFHGTSGATKVATARAERAEIARNAAAAAAAKTGKSGPAHTDGP